MNYSTDAEEIYNLQGQSPRVWLEQAMYLKMSADLIWHRFQQVPPVPQVVTGIRAEMVSLVQSYMMLTGFSLENLIKGTHIVKTPALSVEERLKEWRSNGGGHGHGISQLIHLVTTVDDDEANLLNRLEVYSVWAGRYPISTKVREFERSNNQGLRSLKSTDREMAERIFRRLSRVIEQSQES